MAVLATVSVTTVSDPHEQCPSGFKLYNQNGARAYGRAVLLKNIVKQSSSPLKSNALKSVEKLLDTSLGYQIHFIVVEFQILTAIMLMVLVLFGPTC